MSDMPVNLTSSSASTGPEGAAAPKEQTKAEGFIETLKETEIVNPKTGETKNAYDVFIMQMAMKAAQDMQERAAKVEEEMKKAGENKG